MDLQKELEKAIRETLKDECGAGSDLRVTEDWPVTQWLEVSGNLDVQHLASHVIETLGLDDYEYAVEIERFGVRLHIMNSEWGTLETTQERLKFYTETWALNGNDEHYKAKLVKRRKAGKVEEV